MPANPPTPPGKKIRYGDLVTVDFPAKAGRHADDPRNTQDNKDPTAGDVRVYLNGEWYVWVVWDGRAAALFPAEYVHLHQKRGG